MELRPQLRQQQKLVMTIFMQQAIKLLQLNTVELAQAIEEELIENPSLELDEEDFSLTEEQISLQKKAEADNLDLQEQQNGSAENDALWEAILGGDNRNAEYVHNMRGGYIYNDLPPIESTLSASDTLIDHLRDQLSSNFALMGNERPLSLFLAI